jgi:DNA polymerase III alpha subunit
MQKDSVGFPIFNSQDIFNLIYQGSSDKIFELFVQPNSEIQQFNTVSENKLSEYTANTLTDKEILQVDDALQSQWFIPEKYKNIDILDRLEKQCITAAQLDRVHLEFAEYKSRNMIPLLKFLVYLVETMTENNIVWGVGRGSSVASYILYIIGIHRIDSLKYNLDFYEFMR